MLAAYQFVAPQSAGGWRGRTTLDPHFAIEGRVSPCDMQR
jgi:hypothetical protein